MLETGIKYAFMLAAVVAAGALIGGAAAELPALFLLGIAPMVIVGVALATAYLGGAVEP